MYRWMLFVESIPDGVWGTDYFSFLVPTAVNNIWIAGAELTYVGHGSRTFWTVSARNTSTGVGLLAGGLHIGVVWRKIKRWGGRGCFLSIVELFLEVARSHIRAFGVLVEPGIRNLGPGTRNQGFLSGSARGRRQFAVGPRTRRRSWKGRGIHRIHLIIKTDVTVRAEYFWGGPTTWVGDRGAEATFDPSGVKPLRSPLLRGNC
ncbi:hypothetical protein BJ322DRAFT_1024259 [Thelephora terrestris]|uniref:Uncharacterized protein n=1 Tax=Thelephora terrestris TaxID=56493 RepID=A0A9P6H659_9AGAM|nr:hypothetical protein BJ322DRAFT_1024259 [Thelephora terrestris]